MYSILLGLHDDNDDHFTGLFAYDFFSDRSILPPFIEVHCGACGRLVSVSQRDKYCPVCGCSLCL